MDVTPRYGSAPSVRASDITPTRVSRTQAKNVTYARRLELIKHDLQSDAQSFIFSPPPRPMVPPFSFLSTSGVEMQVLLIFLGTFILAAIPAIGFILAYYLVDKFFLESDFISLTELS